MSALLIIHGDGKVDALRVSSAPPNELLELAHACSTTAAELLEMHFLRGQAAPAEDEDDHFDGVPVAEPSLNGAES